MTTVYTKPNCVQCEATKRYLDRTGVEYNTVDITKDPEGLELILGMGFSEAPVVLSEAGNWSGFKPDQLSLLAA